MSLKPPKVIVLDRDGVINQDSPDYIRTPDEWHAIPGSLDAIARLYAAGYLLVVATNQSGVGRGLFSLDTLWDIHKKMLAEVAAAGGYIEKIFFCLHTPEDKCMCRKPAPGLLYQVAEVFACRFDQMIMIGDSARDMEAAKAVGAQRILVRTGNGKHTEAELAPDDRPMVADSLAAAVDALLAEGSV
jgi:D-glycero-D-manno-heptose 1,7-bisphosphate phosphatase